MRKPRVKTALETKTKQFNFIPSKVKSLITRPTSQFKAYKQHMQVSQKGQTAEKKQVEQQRKEFISVATLNLRDPHHLLKAIINLNQNQSAEVMSCTQQHVYDVGSKNLHVQKVREAFGHRVYQKQEKQRDVDEFNGSCKMQQSEKISQLMANAMEPKPRIPLYKLTSLGNKMYFEKLQKLKDRNKNN